MQPQPPPTELFAECRKNFNIMHGILQCIMMTFRPFLHQWGKHGELYYGRHAFFGYFLFLPVYFTLWGHDPTVVWLIGFWCLSLAMLVLQQLVAREKRAAGYVCHSLSSGPPWPWMPGKTNFAIKGGTEPMVLLVVGFLALILSPALGIWMMLGGFAQAVEFDIAARHEKARIRAMQDSQIEYLSIARGFRRDGDE